MNLPGLLSFAAFEFERCFAISALLFNLP